MTDTMSIKKLRPSYDFIAERIDLLKLLIPEAFADGKINWDTLREVLGDHFEDESSEHFGTTWPGKRDARRFAVMPSRGTLVPIGDGVDEKTTHNIFIEGDNLEVVGIRKRFSRTTAFGLVECFIS